MKQHHTASDDTPEDRPLRARQRRFVEEYLKHADATRAARDAGYSAEYARRAGERLMARPNVTKALRVMAEQKLTAKPGKGRGLQRRVLRELARIAFGDPRWLASWGPDGIALKSSDAMGSCELALVAEIAEGSRTSKDGRGSIKIKRQDKMKALELLMKYLGMLPGKSGEK